MKKSFMTTQSDLLKYNGTTVAVLYELDESEYDKEEVGQMYRIRLIDGNEINAFEDELV